MKRQTTIATQKATEVVIKTDEDYEGASKLLSQIKTVQKAVKTEKDKVLKPLLEATAAERDRWRPIEDDASNAEGIVKQKMVVYVNKKDAEARAREAKIQKDLESGKIDMEKASTKMEKIAQAPANIGTSEVRKVRKVYITNPDLIPDKYWSINESMVRADVMAGFSVPGAELREEKIIAGSTR